MEQKNDIDTINLKELKLKNDLNTIKVLSDDVKNFVVELEKTQKNNCVVLNQEKTEFLLKGYLGKKDKNGFNNRLKYAYARVLCCCLGYAKKPTGKTKTLIEDIKRVSFDSKKMEIGFNFKDKNNFIK